MFFRKLFKELELKGVQFILFSGSYNKFENCTNETTESVYELSFKNSEMVIKEIEPNGDDYSYIGYVTRYNSISISKRLEYLDKLNKYLRENFFPKAK